MKLLILPALLLACGDYVREPLAAAQQGPPPLASITLMPAQAVVMRGGQLPFQATCRDVNNVNVPCPPLTWTTENASVGTVGPQGLFWAAQQFTATVRAASGTVSGTAQVTVTP